MYRATLADAINYGPFAEIAGVITASSQFIDLLNQAQRRLMRRGDWFDQDVQMNFCVSGDIIAWPRYVGAIRAFRFAGCHHQSPGSSFNNWYSFVSPAAHGWNSWNSNPVIEDINSAPTFNDITGTTGKQIRYYTVNAADNGAGITLFGNRYGGQPLQEIQGAATVNGLTLTAAPPYATNATLVTNIDAITRDATQGMAYLYEYDPSNGQLRDLAAFEPGETNPRYRRSRIKTRPLGYLQGQPDANGIRWTSVEALVKVEFVPVVNPRDFLMIDNFDALKFMIQAINLEEANDEQSALIKITKAVQELNFDLRNKNRDEQTVVVVDALMGRGIKSAY